MNLLKLFNSGLDKGMCKAALPLGGMDLSKPGAIRGVGGSTAMVIMFFCVCVACCVSPGHCHLSCVKQYQNTALRWYRFSHTIS